jgi:hypothetical protein
MKSKNSQYPTMNEILIENAKYITDLEEALATVYLNHIADDSVHGSSLRRMLDALGEKYEKRGLNLKFDIYK